MTTAAASVRPPTGLDSYGFQLGCYALAARHFVKEGVAVRTGIAFLREKAPEPELSLAPPVPLDLVALARDLLARRASQEWPGREEPTCKAMGCGYTYRCHPKL